MKKNFFLKIVSVLVAAFILMSSLPVAMAAQAATEPAKATAAAAPGDTASPQDDGTEWFFRYYEGKWQKRLWSHYYEKWLTDWIDM